MTTLRCTRGSQSKTLFVGGRAGWSRKKQLGYEIHARLSATRIQHCLIEGDNLDMASRRWATARRSPPSC